MTKREFCIAAWERLPALVDEKPREESAEVWEALALVTAAMAELAVGRVISKERGVGQ